LYVVVVVVRSSGICIYLLALFWVPVMFTSIVIIVHTYIPYHTIPHLHISIYLYIYIYIHVHIYLRAHLK